jgi:glucan phosphoethanolaminetransferase (alkaline phosphatase superfamily)
MYMSHNATPRRSVGLLIGALIIAFLCGSAFNYYFGVFLSTQTPLNHFSWNVPGEQRVFLATFCSWLLVAALLNSLAVRRVIRRGLEFKGALFLGFSLSFAAYLLLAVWAFINV